MSAPNEFIPSASHTFHHESVAPLVIQAAHSNSNFANASNTNGAHFNGTGFFPNSVGYDVAMLPFLHHTSQRPPHFNTSFAHQKQIPTENHTKDELIQISAPDGRSNVFNPEPNNSSVQSAYWSRQSQLSPFGVLPHEISPEHIEPEGKYELNTHFTPAVANSLNHMPTDCIDREKKTQVIVSGKSKEPNIKKPFIPKPPDAKLQMNYNEDINFRNGVINHGAHANMKLENKMINYKNPKLDPEPLQVNEPVNTVPRDYRVFKPPLFPNSSVPVVKFTGKSKQYVPKPINNKSQSTSPALKNHRLNSNGSPLIQHKISDFQEESQSSPISLTSNDISEHQYPPSSDIVQTIKEPDNQPSFHNLNHVNNNVPHTNTVTPTYREQISNINCQDKKVTQPFAKLPYPAVINTQNNIVDSQLNRNRTSFAPLYIMYNNPPVVTPTPQKQIDKPPEHQDLSQIKLGGISQETGIKPPTPNGLVGYSSVIMRTDRNYEEDKDKASRRMGWTPDRQIPLKSDKLMYNKSDQQHQSATPDQHHLLGLTERQHSYFDTAPCTQVNSPINNMKCSPKSLIKNIYEEPQRIPESPQVPQDPMHYQQFMPLNKPQMPVNPPIEPQSEIDKSFRKRKSSKSNLLDTRVNVPEYSRDPPPAHLNLYQQPLQNSGYVMENNRYDHGKMFPSNEQFYQSNINYNMNVPQENSQQQIVVSNNSSSRVSPPNRNIPPITPSLPLSAYFSSFHSNSQYHDFPPPETQNYVSNEVQTFPENKMEKEVHEGRIKVIVPNVEEEFKFLFDPTLPNYKQISLTPEEEEVFKKPIGKPMFYRKNIDFLASYIKFLENNCESVETLTDSNSSSIKTWNRNKVIYQPITREKSDETELPVPKELPKPAIKEPETNFENDPRYYPLPKSSDKRRLDSSSDESSDEFGKLKPVLKKSEEKKKTLKKDRKEKFEKKFKKDRIKFRKESSPEIKNVKTKLEKLERAKMKIAKLQMKAEKKKHKADKIKPKVEKALAEIKAIQQSGQQKSKTKDQIREQKSIPRRKVSDRKAKDEFILKQKIQGAIDSDYELHSDSDSDPSWTPRADDDDCVAKRKSNRIRSIRFKAKEKRKSDPGTFRKNYTSGEESSASARVKESPKSSKATENGLKFYVSKKEASNKHPNIWHLLNEVKLQKFEHFEQDGRHLYRAVFEFCKFTENDKNKYQEVEISVVEDKNDKLIIELCDDTDIPTDLKIKENFMKESLCYEHQFAVYIQTLVSQALDSNFLSEIVKENDLYFLNNMKVIDEVTATYLSDLTGVVKWGDNTVNILVKTWPFISIKNIRHETNKTPANCASCNLSNAKQTAIFYGQPYQRETLQGCKPNSSIPNDLDKTINLCKGCVREVKLFNKIWHQKYQVFVECAKYVSKKKSEDKCKGTTDVLNELLADTSWLSKLFYDIRNTWLQIWTIVQKSKES